MNDDAYQPEAGLIKAWLTWAYASIESRNLAHRKVAVKRKLLVEAASKLLSPDELARVNQEAEDKL